MKELGQELELMKQKEMERERVVKCKYVDNLIPVIGIFHVKSVGILYAVNQCCYEG